MKPNNRALCYSLAMLLFQSVLILLSSLLVAGCSNPAAPTAPATQPYIIQFSINVPTASIARDLTGQYPHGLAISPVAAQAQFNFAGAYGGTPNVYAGETAPALRTYQNVGIVVAPYRAASQLQFTAADWPGICPNVCSWRATSFVFVLPVNR